ncbi:hypothetical protein, partial [Calidithermus chliarophilus]|uniref:hypothetical protein n=1 Tax=Calidithermus chliarophilus TaxID=52023 RepID=UPI001C54C6CF
MPAPQANYSPTPQGTFARWSLPAPAVFPRLTREGVREVAQTGTPPGQGAARTPAHAGTEARRHVREG